MRKPLLWLPKRKEKTLQTYPFIASVSSYSVVPGAWSLPLFSGVQHGLYGGNDDPDLPVSQFIRQGVKLPTRRGFPICRVPKEELIHGDVITGHEFQKDLEARMLPLVLNIGEISGRKIHLIAHFISGLFLSRPRCFDCGPIRAKINFLYWSLCHIHSPSYILLFTFLSGYVYIVPLIS